MFCIWQGGCRGVREMRTRKVPVQIASTLISLAAVAYILLTLDMSSIRGVLARLDLFWLTPAYLAYYLNILLRAVRFRTLFYSRKVPLRDLIPLSAMHNMFVYVMPAQSGDLSFVMLSRGRLGISIAEGTATLVSSRFYDIVMVGLIMAGILPFTGGGLPAWILKSSILFSSLVLGGSLLLVLYVRSGRTLALAWKPRLPLLGHATEAWNRFVEGLHRIRSGGGSWSVARLTLGIWFCLYADYYFIARSLGITISFMQISTIALVMIPLALLPLQGFANVGTHELAWVGVLRAFGYSYTDALSIALGSHFLLLVIILTYGGLALLQAAAAQGRDKLDDLE